MHVEGHWSVPHGRRRQSRRQSESWCEAPHGVRAEWMPSDRFRGVDQIREDR